MPTRRMLHTKISISRQVDKLPLPAKLLFTWLIAHGDDDGRLSGDPKYVKATIVPYMKWSTDKIKSYLELMHKEGLIYYWEVNSEWFIEFVKWRNHQTLKNDRYKQSSIPSYHKEENKNLEPIRFRHDSIVESQPNVSESNENKFNKSEDNQNQIKNKKSLLVNPKDFEPKNEAEMAAYDAWNTLEPSNPMAFGTTYINALRNGLPASIFNQFTSEIKADRAIQNRGAVFNTKVKNYFAKL